MFRGVVCVALARFVLKAEAAGRALAGSCVDITAANKDNGTAAEMECYKNIIWAADTGIKQDPEWYTPYGLEEADRKFVDYQKVLWEKGIKEKASEAHDCPMPCTSSLPDKVTSPSEELTDEGEPPMALPIWACVLIGSGLCCCLPLLAISCSAFICYESVSWIFGGSSEPKKGKRSIKAKKVAPATPAAEVPQPVASTTAQPMAMFTTAPPVYVDSAPQTAVSYAAPMVTSMAYSAQPAVSYAAPQMSYTAQPAVSYAAPQMSYAAQPVVSYVGPQMSYAAQPVVSYAAPQMSLDAYSIPQRN